MDVRIHRRYQELVARGDSTTKEQVAESLAFRDHIDTTREDSPLRQADDAVVIDNTYLDRRQQLDLALSFVRKKIEEKNT